MIVEYKNGKLTAIAETIADMQFLLSLPQRKAQVLREVEDTAPTMHKKWERKKRNKILLCPTCNKACKGKNGIALHTLRAHEGINWPSRGIHKGEKLPIIEQTIEAPTRPIGERTYPALY